MFAALRFLVKALLALAVFALIWHAGGSVRVDNFGYTVNTSAGVAAIIVLMALGVLMIVGAAIRAVVTLPQTMIRGYERHNRNTGMQSLTYGLSAVAAGDERAARYYADRAERLLPDDTGLVALLSGLSARLSGDEKRAEDAFRALLRRNETAFLGIRGLLQTALERGDNRYARTLARKAFESHPKQPWIVMTLYDLELKHRDFPAALTLLKKAEKLGALTKRQAAQDRAAIALAQGDIAGAVTAAPDYLPAVIAAIADETARPGGRSARRRVRRMIRACWAVTPHPALMMGWIGFAPPRVQENPARIIAHAEDLYAGNADDPSANLYMAEIAMRYDYTGQARQRLTTAINRHPTMRAYRLMAEIEPLGGWADAAATAQRDKLWVCTRTGRIYPDWRPFNDENMFNTIIWNYPDDAQDKNAPPALANTPFFLSNPADKAA